MKNLLSNYIIIPIIYILETIAILGIGLAFCIYNILKLRSKV